MASSSRPVVAPLDVVRLITEFGVLRGSAEAPVFAVILWLSFDATDGVCLLAVVVSLTEPPPVLPPPLLLASASLSFSASVCEDERLSDDVDTEIRLILGSFS